MEFKETISEFGERRVSVVPSNVDNGVFEITDSVGKRRNIGSMLLFMRNGTDKVSPPSPVTEIPEDVDTIFNFLYFPDRNGDTISFFDSRYVGLVNSSSLVSREDESIKPTFISSFSELPVPEPIIRIRLYRRYDWPRRSVKNNNFDLTKYSFMTRMILNGSTGRFNSWLHE